MQYRGAILDVDGTVLRGESQLPGAAEGLAALETRGIDRLFVSNNPLRSSAGYAAKLRNADIHATADDVITAATSTAAYLSRNHAGERLFLVGEEGLRAQLTDAGFTVDLAGEEGLTEQTPDVVVVSIDRAFDYDCLTETLELVRAEELPIVGSDPDVVIPSADGDIPGSGAMIAAVTAVAEREPDAVLGKPHPITRELALERLNMPATDCLVVGDRLDTDIALGAASGMTTVLVRSGVTNGARLERASVRPDYVVDSLAQLAGVLDGDAEQYRPY